MSYSKLNKKHSNFNKEPNGSLEHLKDSVKHSKYNLRSKQKINTKKTTLFRIATIKSRVKGHHVNNYKYTIGQELECKLQAQNKYNSHATMVLAKEETKSQKEKQAKNRIKS